MTAHAQRLLLRKLEGLSEAEAIRQLERSIESGWKTVYPENGSTSDPASDAWKARQREVAAERERRERLEAAEASRREAEQTKREAGLSDATRRGGDPDKLAFDIDRLKDE